jgi:hypothetical protein
VLDHVHARSELGGVLIIDEFTCRVLRDLNVGVRWRSPRRDHYASSSAQQL